jgi:GTP-binding protein
LKDAESGDIIADLDEPTDEILIARGGKGGRGNVHFATPTRQTPRIAEPGREGEEREIILELKLLADVGLIGLPNAGKSTLISTISSAKPKIADYPFTTLRPYLGIVKAGDFRSLVVADIPGLIEGAHRGAGLGFQFLRHIERSKILLHLVDVSDMTSGDPAANLKKINRELSLYSSELILRKQTIAATKVDVVNEKKLKRLIKYCTIEELPFFQISAVTGTGIRELVLHLSEEVKRIWKQ